MKALHDVNCSSVEHVNNMKLDHIGNNTGSFACMEVRQILCIRTPKICKIISNHRLVASLAYV